MKKQKKCHWGRQSCHFWSPHGVNKSLCQRFIKDYRKWGWMKVASFINLHSFDLTPHDTRVCTTLGGLPFMTSTLRGEGVPSKADIVRNLSKGGCVNLRTRGGGDQKIRKLYGSPPTTWTTLRKNPHPPHGGNLFLIHDELQKWKKWNTFLMSRMAMAL